MSNDALNEEVDLRQVILAVQNYIYEIWNKKFVVLAFCVPFLLLNIYRYTIDTPSYEAKFTYMLNAENGYSASGFASLLGSFGLVDRSKGISLEKLVALSKSQNIINKTLLTKTVIDGIEDYLANHIINIYSLHDEWREKDNEEIREFYFSSDSVGTARTENLVLKILNRKLLGSPSRGIEGILSSGYDEETGILNFSIQSLSEDLTCKLGEMHFLNLKEFFVSKAIEKQILNYKIMKRKTDSLEAELRLSESQLARILDSERGLYRAQDKLKRRQLEGKIQILYVGLGKALENLEIADFSLKYQTPFLQIIDNPIPPIPAQRKSLVILIIYALIIGIILGLTFVLARKLYSDIMSTP